MCKSKKMLAILLTMVLGLMPLGIVAMEDEDKNDGVYSVGGVSTTSPGAVGLNSEVVPHSVAVINLGYFNEYGGWDGGYSGYGWTHDFSQFGMGAGLFCVFRITGSVVIITGRTRTANHGITFEIDAPNAEIIWQAYLEGNIYSNYLVSVRRRNGNSGTFIMESGYIRSEENWATALFVEPGIDVYINGATISSIGYPAFGINAGVVTVSNAEIYASTNAISATSVSVQDSNITVFANNSRRPTVAINAGDIAIERGIMSSDAPNSTIIESTGNVFVDAATIKAQHNDVTAIYSSANVNITNNSHIQVSGDGSTAVAATGNINITENAWIGSSGANTETITSENGDITIIGSFVESRGGNPVTALNGEVFLEGTGTVFGFADDLEDLIKGDFYNPQDLAVLIAFSGELGDTYEEDTSENIYFYPPTASVAWGFDAFDNTGILFANGTNTNSGFIDVYVELKSAPSINGDDEEEEEEEEDEEKEEQEEEEEEEKEKEKEEEEEEGDKKDDDDDKEEENNNNESSILPYHLAYSYAPTTPTIRNQRPNRIQHQDNYPTVDVLLNGTKITLPLEDNNSIVLTESIISTHKNNTGVFNIYVPMKNYLGINLPIDAVADDNLVISLNVGTVLLNNGALMSIKYQFGNEMRLFIEGASYRISMLDENNNEVMFYDPKNPLFITFPIASGSGVYAGAYIAVAHTLNSVDVLPYSIYHNNNIILKTASTGTFSGQGNDVFFYDTSGHWARDAIVFVAARNIFEGTGNSMFSPTSYMTRAMFAHAIANISGADLSMFTTSRFDDVSANSWYAPAIEWASYAGLVNGIGNNLFAPNAYITREQMATMLSNYANDAQFEYLLQNHIAAFYDYDLISPWATRGVSMVQGAGIIQGRPNGRFYPSQPATRAEVATLFANYINAYFYKFKS